MNMARKSGLRTSPFSIIIISLTTMLALSGCGGGSEGLNSGTSSVNTLPSGTTSSVNLTWESPTTNTDQSCLTNLSGYIVSYGPSSGTYTNQETISVNSLSCTNNGAATACGNVQSCTYTVRGLSQGQWFFTTTAYTADMVISSLSNEASISVN